MRIIFKTIDSQLMKQGYFSRFKDYLIFATKKGGI